MWYKQQNDNGFCYLKFAKTEVGKEILYKLGSHLLFAPIKQVIERQTIKAHKMVGLTFND